MTLRTQTLIAFVRAFRRTINTPVVCHPPATLFYYSFVFFYQRSSHLLSPIITAAADVISMEQDRELKKARGYFDEPSAIPVNCRLITRISHSLLNY